MTKGHPAKQGHRDKIDSKAKYESLVSEEIDLHAVKINKINRKTATREKYRSREKLTQEVRRHEATLYRLAQRGRGAQ